MEPLRIEPGDTVISDGKKYTVDHIQSAIDGISIACKKNKEFIYLTLSQIQKIEKRTGL